MNRIYFDNAATTPLHPDVIQAMTEAMEIHYGNPSSIHKEGRTSRSVVEQARRTVAQLLGASIGEIFFTSGGTESSNMALKCSVRDLGVKRIISSKIEHHCVLHTLEQLEKNTDVQVDWVNVNAQGHVDTTHLKTLLDTDKGKTLVSLMHVNNEIGTMIDLDEIAALCEEHNALFHTDTVQSVAFYPIDVSKTKISFLTGSAHKFNGPKGVGFIYINGDNNIAPFIDGGAQERNMRGGTENIYGIVGMAKALEVALKDLDARKSYIKGLRDYLADQLQANFDDIEFVGDPMGRGAYKILSVGFPPSPKAELLLLNLDIAGVSASGGSACSSGAEVGSHVLEALKGADNTMKMVRFSFGYQNTKEEVDQVVEKLKQIIPAKESAEAN